jgi:transcriptional regulator with XRE-family HTH domain
MHDDSDAPAFKQPSAKALELARAIRRARGDMGQIQFAAVIGRVQSVVSQWENGKSTPSLESLAMIEERIGLPMGTLAAEAGYFTQEAAAAAGFSSVPLASRPAAGLKDALRLVRAADELGFGVRMRARHVQGDQGALWLVEVLAPDGDEVLVEVEEVSAGRGQA